MRVSPKATHIAATGNHVLKARYANRTAVAVKRRRRGLAAPFVAHSTRSASWKIRFAYPRVQPIVAMGFLAPSAMFAHRLVAVKKPSRFPAGPSAAPSERNVHWNARFASCRGRNSVTTVQSVVWHPRVCSAVVACRMALTIAARAYTVRPGWCAFRTGAYPVAPRISLKSVATNAALLITSASMKRNSAFVLSAHIAARAIGASRDGNA